MLRYNMCSKKNKKFTVHKNDENDPNKIRKVYGTYFIMHTLSRRNPAAP